MKTSFDVCKIVWVLLLAAWSVACGGPSVADMEKTWHQNEENVQKYQARYPGFRTALDDMLGSAKKDFEAAKTGEDKTRGERMRAINDRVAGSLKNFDVYQTEVDKLEKLMKDKDLNDLPASKFNPANDAAKEAVKRAKGIMGSRPANMGEARGKLEEAVSALQRASQGLEALRPAKPTAPASKSTSSPAGTSAAKKKK
jgi:septation ring formation regulator EzrA